MNSGEHFAAALASKEDREHESPDQIPIFNRGFLTVSLPRGYPDVLQFEIDHPRHGGASCGLARIEVVDLRNRLNEWLEQPASREGNGDR